MLNEPLYLAIIYYAVYSFYGWVCETVYCSVWEKRYARRGFLRGPYCPVYGLGAVLVLTLCIHHKENPALVFCITLVAASVVEYLTGWLFETALQMRLWDYSGNRLNIKGRVCLLNSILFGFLGLAAIYVVHPPTVKLIALADPVAQRIAASGLAAIMGLDFCSSLGTAAGLNDKLNAIRAQGVAGSPLGRVLEKLDALTVQKDASWRIVKNYPTLKPKHLEAELALLRQYWEQDKTRGRNLFARLRRTRR